MSPERGDVDVDMGAFFKWGLQCLRGQLAVCGRNALSNLVQDLTNHDAGSTFPTKVMATVNLVLP